MHIQHLQSVGSIKGRLCLEKLTPCNLITGASFSGKSRFVELLNLGLLGYIPKYGKQPGETLHAVAGGADKLGVVLTFNTGQKNVVTIERNSAGGASVSAHLHVECPSVMLDFKEYLRLSGPDRVAYVLTCASAPDKVISAALTKALNKVVVPAGCGPETQREIKLVSDNAARCASSGKGYMLNWLIGECTALAKKLTDYKRELKANQDKMIVARWQAEVPPDVAQVMIDLQRKKASELNLQITQAISADAAQTQLHTDKALAATRPQLLKAANAAHAAYQKLAKKPAIHNCPHCNCGNAKKASALEALTDAKQALAECDEACARLKNTKATKSNASSQLAKLRTAATAASREYERLVSMQAQRQAYEANATKLKQLEQLVVDGTKIVQAIAAVQAELNTLRAEQITSTFEKLLSVANEFTADILNSPIEYGSEQMELGRRVSRDGRSREK